MIVIGMMSGTSADGIDAVVVKLSELDASQLAPQWELLKHIHLPYTAVLREQILNCARADTGTVDRICALNFDLGAVYAQAARTATEAARLALDDIDLIGHHGQTVWHIHNHSTLQVGSPAVIAEATGVTVVSNFRARDIAAGGHGAPLVAYVDALLLTDTVKARAAQNIGGIANVTWLPANQPQRAFAFDTGPGNMLIDDAVQRATDGALHFDDDGKIAARGRVDETLLAELMAHPFLKQPPPKTTGREMFGAPFGNEVWGKATARGDSSDDLITTLTMFTAKSTAQAYRDFLPSMPDELIVSGGGANNPTLLAMLQSELNTIQPARVRRIDELGIPSEAKEALAFALLAYQTWHGRPSNLPNATGARHPVILGDITPGRNWNLTSEREA